MKARKLSDAWKATMLVWAAGATLIGALYLDLSDQPLASRSQVTDLALTPLPSASGLRRPIPPRQVVTRTRAS